MLLNTYNHNHADTLFNLQSLCPCLDYFWMITSCRTWIIFKKFSLRVLLSIFLMFFQFQTDFAYKSVAKCYWETWILREKQQECHNLVRFDNSSDITQNCWRFQDFPIRIDFTIEDTSIWQRKSWRVSVQGLSKVYRAFLNVRYGVLTENICFKFWVSCKSYDCQI